MFVNDFIRVIGGSANFDYIGMTGQIKQMQIIHGVCWANVKLDDGTVTSFEVGSLQINEGCSKEEK